MVSCADFIEQQKLEQIALQNLRMKTVSQTL